MLIVAGTFTVAPENREQVLELARPVMDATRQEAGCIEYVMTPDTVQPDLIRLFEIWESNDHLKAHLETDHIREWRETGGDLLTGRAVTIYDIEASREL